MLLSPINGLVFRCNRSGYEYLVPYGTVTERVSSRYWFSFWRLSICRILR